MKLRIMIVGDQDTAEVTDTLIKRSYPDCSTLLSSDGLKAVRQALEWAPDMIFLMNILYMPGLNGLELCERLRAEPELKGVKIVVSSARRAEVDSLLAGAAAFLPKLFNHKDIKEIIDGLAAEAE